MRERIFKCSSCIWYEQDRCDPAVEHETLDDIENCQSYVNMYDTFAEPMEDEDDESDADND